MLKKIFSRTKFALINYGIRSQEKTLKVTFVEHRTIRIWTWIKGKADRQSLESFEMCFMNIPGIKCVDKMTNEWALEMMRELESLWRVVKK